MKLAGMLLMVAFLLWLPIEDTTIWATMILGAALSLWLGWRWQQTQPASGWAASLRGALLGFAAPLLAVSLMAFKGSLHGHGFADFTVRQVLHALALLPFTVLVGLLTPPGLQFLNHHLREEL